MPKIEPLDTYRFQSIDTPVAILDKSLDAIAVQAGLKTKRMDIDGMGMASVAFLRLHSSSHVAMLILYDADKEKKQGPTVCFEGSVVGQNEISDLVKELREGLAMPGLGISWQADASRRHDYADFLDRPVTLSQPGVN
jgi:hypothetical protein